MTKRTNNEKNGLERTAVNMLGRLSGLTNNWISLMKLTRLTFKLIILKLIYFISLDLFYLFYVEVVLIFKYKYCKAPLSSGNERFINMVDYIKNSDDRIVSHETRIL